MYDLTNFQGKNIRDTSILIYSIYSKRYIIHVQCRSYSRAFQYLDWSLNHWQNQYDSTDNSSVSNSTMIKTPKPAETFVAKTRQDRRYRQTKQQGRLVIKHLQKKQEN